MKASLTFPNGRFDDQVDSLSQFLGWADFSKRFRARSGRTTVCTDRSRLDRPREHRIPNLVDTGPFHGADWPSRLGGRRGAMRAIGQAAQHGRRAKPPHRRPPSFVRRRRPRAACGARIAAQPAPIRRAQDGGEMGPYQRDLVVEGRGEADRASGGQRSRSRSHNLNHGRNWGCRKPLRNCRANTSGNPPVSEIDLTGATIYCQLSLIISAPATGRAV
jgi:hypothetical protein